MPFYLIHPFEGRDTMPKLVPQSLKSMKTIELQPDKMSPKIEVILALDLAGRKGKDIAMELGMCESRISIIKNSPLYINRLADMRRDLEDRFMEKRSDKLSSGDPVEEALKGAALEAAQKKIDLMQYSANELVQSAAAGDILDRAGYKSHTEKTKVTVEVTEKMADRFERALEYESNNDDRETKVSITQEVSS
jgi:hypothetical protein